MIKYTTTTAIKAGGGNTGEPLDHDANFNKQVLHTVERAIGVL
jgi:hypothetical protein